MTKNAKNAKNVKVKDEFFPDATDDDNNNDAAAKNNNNNTNNKGNANRNQAKAAPGGKPGGKKKREPSNNMTSSDISNAIKDAVNGDSVMRCGDGEVADTKSKLHEYIKRRVGAKYVHAPHATVRELGKQKKLWALTFAWKKGERVFLHLSRVFLCKIFVPHPEAAPKGEPRSVTRDIDTTDTNNFLALIKHADDNGIKTGVHFTGLTMATALISLDLLFTEA